MQLFCTRALLSAMELPVLPPAEQDPLCCWTADLITRDRKRLIVIVNQLTRYAVVLYGVGKEELRHLPSLFMDGLANQMLSDGFTQSSIEQFWASAPGVQLTECADGLMQARLHKACTRAVAFAHPPLPNAMVQPAWSRYVNGTQTVAPFEAAPVYPLRALTDALSARSGAPVRDLRGVVLSAHIETEILSIERTLRIPAWYTFDRLHLALQEAFCWQEAGPYEFRLPKEGRSVIFQFDGWQETADEQAFFSELAQVGDCLPPDSEALYRYGYGEEGWDVRLQVLESCELPAEPLCAVCLSGSGEAPPEGVGGEGGYLEFLDALHTPDDPDSQAQREQAEEAGWRPFALEEVNERMRFMLLYE